MSMILIARRRLGFARRADFSRALRLDLGGLFEAQVDLALGELGGVGDAGVCGFGVGPDAFERVAIADRGENFEQSNLRVAVDVAEEDVERRGAFELLEVRDGLSGQLLLVERANEREEALVLPHAVECPVHREARARVLLLRAVAFDEASVLDRGEARDLFRRRAPLEWVLARKLARDRRRINPRRTARLFLCECFGRR